LGLVNRLDGSSVALDFRQDHERLLLLPSVQFDRGSNLPKRFIKLFPQRERGHEADHSLPSNDEVRKVSSYRLLGLFDASASCDA
jgi:hypothetical protein